MSKAIENQENTSEVEGHGLPSKRARTSKSTQNAPPRKRIKGRQGGLQGIMKMPIEIFMEIAPYVDPGDLITLIRTSKFFRSMLLVRSAARIWQSALNNVPGLPPCPTGMVEPQYAALMFTKNCTNCGVQVMTSKADPYLGVRLCPSCRETELKERPLLYLIDGVNLPYTFHIKRFKNSRHKKSAYQLRAHQQEYERVRMECVRNEDKDALDKWKEQQQIAWNKRREEGDELLHYINVTAESRSDELQDLKAERREQILERLRALGWDDKYFVSWRGSNTLRKQWRALLEVPKALTERTWKNMLPKLTRLLEENRPVIDKHEQEQRRDQRRSKVADLLREFGNETNPYQPIIDTLQQSPASTTSQDGTTKRIMLRAPFPDDGVIGTWNFITNLYEEEHSIEKVEELFNERREILGQELSEWRTKVEDQLIRQYTSTFTEGTKSSINTTLTVKGSTDAAKHLSENTRFLLRADTIFMDNRTVTGHDKVDQEHGPIAEIRQFPNIYPIQKNTYLYGCSQRYNPDEVARGLESYVRHAGKEAIIKALLRDLDMPNVTHLELTHMGEVFICGRCNGNQAMEWNGIVSNTVPVEIPISSRFLGRTLPHKNKGLGRG
ncbi:unnamed protein product [Rhizoctonia solani]|uniref:F-box domain-containing protein n=1 Tax=Rhizoctonia solani TaxID=456999 RepID=A0A8H2WAB3_9AGAM|nr:unnamed protein product [Rhizoctonia solani]